MLAKPREGGIDEVRCVHGVVEQVADDLGVACDNTAKWLTEFDLGRTMIREGQLLIVDEATLAGTATLDRITGNAEAMGAKVLLVGDPYQLQSVEAGGAFSLLVVQTLQSSPRSTGSPTGGRSTPRWHCASARSRSSRSGSLPARFDRLTSAPLGRLAQRRPGEIRHHARRSFDATAGTGLRDRHITRRSTVSGPAGDLLEAWLPPTLRPPLWKETVGAEGARRQSRTTY